MISIGDLAASPGQKVSGNIQIHAQAPAGVGTNNTSNATTSTTTTTTTTTTAATTSTDIPVTIINGVEEGPTVVVLSGIHGSEYIPILTSQRLAKTLNNSTELKLNNGALILIHIANLPAYLGRTIYTSPADDQNLNRVFPGKSNGTLSEQIAYVLVEHVYPLADYVLDIHSGDGNERLGPSYTAYYGKAGSDSVIQASKNMAIAFGLDLMVEFQWELQPDGDNDNDNDNNNNNINSTARAIWAGAAAVVRGIPSIDVEMAPGMGSTRQDSIDQAYQGVLRVMVHLKMLPETIIHKKYTNMNVKEDQHHDPHPHQPCLVKDRHFIESPLTGSWTPLIDTGTFVQKGASLGYLMDFYGRTKIYEAEAPTDGLLLIRFESPPVVEGDTLAVMAVLNTSDPVCERLRQDGLLHLDGSIDANTDSDIDTGAGADILILWQWAAVIGWLVTFTLGLGILIKKRRVRNRNNNISYQQPQPHAHVPTID